MHGEPGIDFPETRAAVDVIRGSDVGMSWVEELTDDVIVVTAAQNRRQQPIRVEPGERVELVWSGPGELRAIPSEVLAVERSEQPRWRLRATGPASRGQRRAAVRAPMQVRVRVRKGAEQLEGVTVDLSEGGMRCVLETPGREAGSDGNAASTEPAGATTAAEPEQQTPELAVGDVVEVAVSGLDEERIEARGEVIRRHRREDPKSEVSVRFIGLSEFQEDTIRRRVFAQLRDMRQRGLA